MHLMLSKAPPGPLRPPEGLLRSPEGPLRPVRPSEATLGPLRPTPLLGGWGGGGRRTDENYPLCLKGHCPLRVRCQESKKETNKQRKENKAHKSNDASS